MTRRGRKTQWGWAALAAGALLGACRSHAEVCDGAECLALPAEGGAGGNEAEAGPGGEGGADPACRRDRDCLDAKRCNGAETCVEGQCVAGEPIACELGTACVDEGDERCVYEAPSPWFVAAGFEDVKGAPLAAMAASEQLLTIAHREREGPLQGFEEIFWAPSGRVALVRSLERDFGYSMELLRLGAGVTATLAPVPNLPSWGELDAPVISRDGARAIVSDSVSGSYLLQLRDVPMPLSQLSARPFSGVEFCADSRLWLEQGEGPESFVASLDDSLVTRRSLGKGYAKASLDGQFYGLQLTDEEDNDFVRIGACSNDDTWAYDFPDADRAEFGPGSQSLLLSLTDGGVRVMSLADPKAPVEQWWSPTATNVYFAAPDRLLLSDTVGDEEATLRFVDLAGGVDALPQSLGLPPSAEIADFTERSLLAWVPRQASEDGEERDLFWQTLPPGDAPELVPNVAGHASLEGVGDVDFRLLVEPSASDMRLSLLHFENGVPVLAPVATLEGSFHAAVLAPDRSGLAVIAYGAVIDSTLYWIPLDTELVAGEPSVLDVNVYSVQFEPAP